MDVQEEVKALLAKVEFKDTNSFSRAFLDYIDGKEELEPFYGAFPSQEALLEQAKKRQFSSETRQITASALKRQYEGFEASNQTLENIEKLRDANTFSVTTGHQLNIFTGPLYFIYKIITVINACERLQTTNPEKNFVPVYWMASEDHDFDEINHFRFGRQKFSWSTDQTGAVGRFKTESIKSIFDQIEMPDFFKEAYLKHENLAQAVRYYVNHLFGEKGLIVMDADDPELKRVFGNVITEDVFENTPHSLVNTTSDQLEAIGYKPLVFPREINFFYLKEDIRSRIVHADGGFEVLDTAIRFTKEELENEIQTHPERFSPNVVLRPLYQETILPNLAYVGGPSELVYWFQLKEVFDHFNTDFPILLPRNFAGVVTPNIQRKLDKEQLSFTELFEDESELIKKKIKQKSTHELELRTQFDKVNTIFNGIKDQAISIDSTLEKLVLAERRRAEKSFEKIEKKLLKAEKRNQETLVHRISDIKAALFPNGSPQERKDNFLNFYLTDPKFIDSCLESFDPFDLRFHLISSNE